MNTIEENTNVTSLRIGSGVIKNIGKDAGRFVVATMEIPWKLTTKLLGAEARKVVIIESIEESWLNEQLSDLPGCDCIIGIGGGQAIDAGKYFAWKLEIPFISIPTIMSVNAFVTPAAGIRRNHQVVYLGEVSPNYLIIDYDIIRSAPRELNIAGIGDLLSIHTASFDWEHAQSKGMSEYPFSSSITRKASEILGELYPHIPAIRNAENEGLKATATINETFIYSFLLYNVHLYLPNNLVQIYNVLPNIRVEKFQFFYNLHSPLNLQLLCK